MAKKILVVDDEPHILTTLKDRLEFNKYEVVTALNGREAVDKVKSDSPDAVVLDLRMPEMDGMETLQEIRKFNKDIPVLILTAYASKEIIEGFMGMGLNIAGFIPKGSEFIHSMEAVLTSLKGHKKLKEKE
jgi:two-component system response regulator VicR